MGIIVVAPIVTFILTMWYLAWDDWKPSRYSKPYEYCGVIEALGLSTLCGGLAILGSLLFALIFGAIYTSEDTVVIDTQETREIYALADGNSISGSFFLGSGSIDDDMKYVYIAEVEGKGYKMQTVDVDYCYVKYSEGTPTVTKITYAFKNDFFKFFGFCCMSDEYTFCIPEGSITNSYVIDLE